MFTVFLTKFISTERLLEITFGRAVYLNDNNLKNLLHVATLDMNDNV